MPITTWITSPMVWPFSDLLSREADLMYPLLHLFLLVKPSHNHSSLVYAQNLPNTHFDANAARLRLFLFGYDPLLFLSRDTRPRITKCNDIIGDRSGK